MKIQWNVKIEYLGMILDKKLTFPEHLNRARRKTIYLTLATHRLNPKSEMMEMSTLDTKKFCALGTEIQRNAKIE